MHKLKFLLCALFLFPALCWADSLELSVAVPKGLSFVKPFDKTVTIHSQPMPFTVMLTNRSTSSQSVYWEPAAGATKSISFELTGEDGRTFVIKRKKITVMSSANVNTYLAAGATVTKTLTMDIDEWENLPVIEPGQVKKYQARALFDNNGQTITSDYYTLILDGR